MKKVDKTLVGWGKKLMELGQGEFVKLIETDIVEDFHLIKKLRLPTYDSYLIPVQEFLDRFSELNVSFIHEKYYLVLLPIREGLNKYSLTGFQKLDEAKEFIFENISKLIDEYMIRISEFEENAYGGSIMSTDEQIIAEISKGLQTGVAYGSAKVELAKISPFSKTVQYSSDNILLNQLLWKAISAIEVKQDSLIADNEKIGMSMLHGKFYFKGYFEFAYTDIPTRDHLRLVFFDLKLGKIYSNISNDLII